MSATQNRRTNKNQQPTVPTSADVVAAPATNVATHTVDVAVARTAAPASVPGKVKQPLQQTAPTPAGAQLAQSAAPVVQTAAPVVQTAEASAESEPVVNEPENHESLMTKLQNNQKRMAELQRENNLLLKELNRDHMQLTKQLKRRSKETKSSKRATSGFNKQKVVPLAFREYLSLPPGTELARTEVTKKVYEQIKAKDLLDPSDRRKILPDAPLKKLFRMGDGETIEFSTFQGFVSRVYDNDPETQALKAADAAAKVAQSASA